MSNATRTRRPPTRRAIRARNARIMSHVGDGLALLGTLALIAALSLLALGVYGVDACALGDFGLAACG